MHCLHLHVEVNLPTECLRRQLYNLASDPGEIHDLATQHPERIELFGKAWDGYAAENGVIRPDSPTAYAKPVVGRKH